MSDPLPHDSAETGPQPGGPPPNGWRTFVALWGTQAFSVLGSGLAGFAFNIYLTQTLYPRPEQKPELAFALSATALAFTLAALIGAPLGGAWADRHDRKRTMIAADLIMGVLALTVALLVLFAKPPVGVLIPIFALMGMIATFHGSAFDTSYSALVPKEKLPRANGMMQTIWSLSGLASPALAAVLIGLPALARQGGGPAWLAGWRDGVPLALLIDAVTFVVAALVLTRLKIPSPKAAASGARRPLRADLTVGWRYILDRRPLLWLLLTFALINFVTAPVGVFQPLLVKFDLAPDWGARGYTFETALALLATIGSVGGVLGGVFISTWGGLRRRRVLGIVIPMIFSGIGLFVFGASHLLFLSAAAVFLTGFMQPIMNAHSQAIWQAQVPNELQGRVFSVRRLIAQFTGPVGMAMAGVLGGLLSPSLVVRVLALVLMAFCLVQVFNPLLRRVEDREWLEELAARRSKERGGPKDPPDPSLASRTLP